MSLYTMTVKELIDLGFDFALDDYPIFSETYRRTLNEKILNRYYFNEIGQETPDRFNFMLRTKMNEIMPYYNKLYKSELMEYDPLINEYYVTRSFGETERKTTDMKQGNTSSNYNDDMNFIRKDNKLTDTTATMQDVSETETQGNTKGSEDSQKQQNNTQTNSSNGYSEQDSEKLLQGGETLNKQYGMQSSSEKFYDAPQTQLSTINNYLTTQTDKNINQHSDSESREYNNRQDVENIKKTDTNTTNLSGTESEHNNITNESENTGTSKSNSTNSGSGSTNEAQEIKDKENKSGNQNDIYNETKHNNGNEIEDVITYLKGRKNKSGSELIQEYRSVLINIDSMIIDNLHSLFMGVM